MFWRNLDSGVLYEELLSTNDMIFIATDCLQCISTATINDFASIECEVKTGKWAAKYPISISDMQKALDGIQICCVGKHVHWITLSRQDDKTIVKMEFNCCSRNGGGIWDIVERLRVKYPETIYSNFRPKKLNRYEEDNSAESQKLIADARDAIANDDKFNELVKEMEDLLSGPSKILINLAEFNRLLYGADYLERFVYAWTAAKRLGNVRLAIGGVKSSNGESKIVGTRNGLLLFKRREKGLQFFLVLLAGGITVLNYCVRGRSDYSTSEVKDWIELWFLLSISIVIGLQSLVRKNWNILDALNGVQTANNEEEALWHYEKKEDHFICDVYNKGLASVTFKDDNASALKEPNGLGWYHIRQPLTVDQLRWIGVRTFWRYDGSISVQVNGVRRSAVKIAADRWHVGNIIDKHDGPEVFLPSGSIGEEQTNWSELHIV